MNEKFFQLSLEKQQNIISAAYKVFSENSYPKSPMSEIAETADISKSLLFYYFKNKKELYLYLCIEAKELTETTMAEYGVAAATDLFEMMDRTMRAKCGLMRKFPYICAFSLNAYYETTPDIKIVVQSVFKETNEERTQAIIKKIDKSKLRPDIDVQVMYQEIELACEGYLYSMYRTPKIDVQRIEQDFKVLVAHWKKVYERSTIS